MSSLLVVGAGGHGVVVADAAELSGDWDRIALLDDRYPSVATIEHWQVIGTSGDLLERRPEYEHAIVAIGDADVRLAICERLNSAGYGLATVAHPGAIISRIADVGAGSVLLANAVVNARAEIGVGCIVNTAATVDHHCKLSDGVHIAPGAHLAANVTVGERSWIGVGASIREGVTIGRNVTVGAGAAVVENVSDGAKVAGVPARRIDQGK